MDKVYLSCCGTMTTMFNLYGINYRYQQPKDALSEYRLGAGVYFGNYLGKSFCGGGSSWDSSFNTNILIGRYKSYN